MTSPHLTSLVTSLLSIASLCLIEPSPLDTDTKKPMRDTKPSSSSSSSSKYPCFHPKGGFYLKSASGDTQQTGTHTVMGGGANESNTLEEETVRRLRLKGQSGRWVYTGQQ